MKKTIVKISATIGLVLIITTLTLSANSRFRNYLGYPGMWDVKSTEYTLIYRPGRNSDSEHKQDSLADRYIIEYRERGSLNWRFKSTSSEFTYNAKNVKEGSELQFSVRAEINGELSKRSVNSFIFIGGTYGSFSFESAGK